MAFNTVQEILVIGSLSLSSIPESSIEQFIAEADDEVDYRVPPVLPTDPNYAFYSRRLPMLKKAAALLCCSSIYKTLAYDVLQNMVSYDIFSTGVGETSWGAQTPSPSDRCERLLAIAERWKTEAEELLKKSTYRIPTVRRPRPLEI